MSLLSVPVPSTLELCVLLHPERTLGGKPVSKEAFLEGLGGSVR